MIHYEDSQQKRRCKMKKMCDIVYRSGRYAIFKGYEKLCKVKNRATARGTPI